MVIQVCLYRLEYRNYHRIHVQCSVRSILKLNLSRLVENNSTIQDAAYYSNVVSDNVSLIRSNVIQSGKNTKKINATRFIVSL